MWQNRLSHDVPYYLSAQHRVCHNQMSRVVRKPAFAYAKTKTQISFAVTAKLISAFVFATRIVQSLFYLNPKFQASSHIQSLYSPVCVRPGRKPRRPVFSQRGSNDVAYPRHLELTTVRSRGYETFFKLNSHECS